MTKFSSECKKLLTPGSAACSVTYAVIGVVLAVLLLTIGLWKTLFILAFAAVGALLGAIGNKKDAVRDAVNRRFPARDIPLKEIPQEKSEKTEDAGEAPADTQE